MTVLRGKVSWFGGPNDKGVSPDEGLAFIYSVDMAPHLFLPEQPPGTTGLARRLDPNVFYIACRWDYDVTSKEDLLDMIVIVRSPATGATFIATPADWGPHEDTGRIADISYGLMEALGIQTDDEIEVSFEGEEPAMPYDRVVISSGHGKYVRGAHGILDEVDEARRVVERLADLLDDRGVEVTIFHDDSSQTQSENLDTIVNFHNSCDRDLDVSVHFNAYEQCDKPMGTEVLYVTQSALASEMSAAIASVGFINRGGKKRTDLAFLNGTEEPSILIEVCFVDSQADADLYNEKFEQVCQAIANVLGGKEEEEIEPPEPPTPTPMARVDIEVSGDVVVTINGVVVHS